MTAVDMGSVASVAVSTDGGRSTGVVAREGHPPVDQLPLDSGVSPPDAGDGGAAALLDEAAQVAVPRRISLIVFGDPAPQGSKRHVGNGVMIEMSKRVPAWREAVKTAGRIEIDARPGWVPLDGCLFPRMVFSFRRPKSHYRTGRNSHLLRDGAPSQPCTTPDISKILRATEDALTQCGIWADDSRVSEYLRLAKVFCGEDRDALDVPGVRIEIREATR